MAIIGDTAVNVTPCSSGSRTPTSEPDRLDDRGDTAGEQVGVDQVDSARARQPIAPASRIGTTTAPA